jgi:ribosomal protein L40E
MIRKIIPKIVFIDTNIFIGCALQETTNLDIDSDKVADIKTLKDIKEKLDDKKMVLVLPENIKAEIVTGMKIKFKELEKNIGYSFPKVNSLREKESGKISMLIKTEIERSKKELLGRIKEKSKKISNIVDEIIEHKKNTRLIELSDELIISGIKRSLLMKRPYTPKLREDGSENSKSAYLKDQDCVAFESFLNYLNENEKELEKSECIICSDDSDYFEKIKENVLHKDITQEIKCKKISGYQNILNMLKKEFDKDYSEKEIKEYKSSVERMQLNIEPRISALYPSAFDTFRSIHIPNPDISVRSPYAVNSDLFEIGSRLADQKAFLKKSTDFKICPKCLHNNESGASSCSICGYTFEDK